ncbi:hypothetical protein BIW11_04071 [Tropilaelaps mercedesae]|uniref:non-specific serine/threonine protein kinase n=1 Tax=Tropilaelaps mercedesae TaxID=418985 RepID=A0A1V9XBJ3_9ACAR|nr:hypothetical protein BIW11_04071 [Tropilaelaps mercedesae]
MSQKSKKTRPEAGGDENDKDLTPYAKLIRDQKCDPEWQQQIALGKRIGLYRMSGDLGTGNFAQVKAATHCLTKERVAIKIISKSKLDSKTQRMLNREIATIEALHHPHAIRLYEVLETLSKVYLVMEFAAGGELYRRIFSKGAFPESDAKVIFTQVCSAIDHMHKQNIVHRDLKAENVFIAGNLYVKVGDYGFSTRINFRDEKLTTFCGSPPYAAPELFKEEKYSGPYVDIWALGIMLYFIVSAAMPFSAPTVSALRKLILEGQYEMPSGISAECRGLIQGILQKVPSERLSLAQILAHGWLDGQPCPMPFEKYNILPQIDKKQPNGDDVSEPSGSSTTILIPHSREEIEARRQLNELGITDAMMDDCQYQGARSMITGAYRIVLHRLQMAELRADLHGWVSEATTSRSPSSTLRRGKNQAETLTRANTEPGNGFTYTQRSLPASRMCSVERGTTRDRVGKTNASKTCVVL